MNIRTSLLLPVIFIVSACNQASVESEPLAAAIATVNGDAITQEDVDFMIQRTFSDPENALKSKETRENVLQSLIASKAMQQAMLKTLPAEKINFIENQTQSYREELFVKEYLLNSAKPKPISTKSVQSYYERHIEEFGGGERTTIELLKTANKPNESQRNSILSIVSQLKANSDWAEFAQSNPELGLLHYRSVVQPGLFDKSIEQSIKFLKEGDLSEIIFVNQVPHLIKVIDKQEITAKPLASVSASIRKKLAAIELKKAIKKASEDVVKQANVQIK